ncbi:kynureninase [Nocardioides pacificus]
MSSPLSTPSSVASAARAAALDAADPLAPLRARFVGAESELVYLDGNSLGRPLAVTADRIAGFVREEWGGRLIRGWDEGWFDLPLTLGDELARVCLGAGPGQTAIGDSTTVLLYKAMRAAVAARPGRSEIVVDRDNFPTDRYVAEGVAQECGLRLRWVDVDLAGGVGAEQLAEAVGPQTALVVLSHVAYRSAWLADMPELTRLAHESGALVLWDLSHSVGSVPVELDAAGVDLAVGCSYKYLNGGPGAPAFVYVAARHLETLTQPVRGWMGARDPFLMGPDYAPAEGIRRFLSGTPPIVGMLAMRDMIALLDEVRMPAVRAKSVALTDYAVELVNELLAPLGVTVASPREARLRGGHVTLSHPAMREVTATLWQRDVIPDYRDPGGLRLGLSPLSTSYDEVRRGLLATREALSTTR